MLIQRKFNEAGKVDHVLIKHTGLSIEQTFSNRLIEAGISDGWISIDGDALAMKAEPTDLLYTIVRHPGYTCRSTGERIPISLQGMTQYMGQAVATIAPREARAWLATKGLPPTDYEADRNYRCVLDADLHEQFRGVLTAPGRRMVAACELKGA